VRDVNLPNKTVAIPIGILLVILSLCSSVIDQYIYGLPGCLPHTKGKESKDNHYNGGTIFVDHASLLMFLKHQVALTTCETLRGKKAFETFASQFGFKIQSYSADKVPFKSAECFQNITDNNRTNIFSSTGATSH
jgi:hypothetical protein